MDKQTYDKPEPPEQQRGRGAILLVLALVVAGLLYLIAAEGYMF